jgi:uncharacterized protein (TIGR03437 family)
VLSKNGPATISAAPFAETLAQITVEGARAATSNWLQAVVNNSSTPATVTASFDPQGLPPGDYLGRIDITSAQAPGPPLQLKFTLRVSSSGPFFWPGSVFQAASYTAGFLSPGAATTIFGLRFGPPSLAGLTLGPDNRVTTAAGQTRVLIDGVPAPMIFAVGGSFSQLSFFAPFSLAGKTSAQVQVEYQGVASNPVTLPVIDVAPGLFTVNSQGFGPGAILNQDTSLNSAQNPARRGEVIVLYGTGYGRTNPTGVDGQQAAAPLPAPLQPISVRIDGKDAVIQYQGSAPQLTEGIFQLNVVIPVDVTPGAAVPIELRQGGKTSIAGPTVAISAN